MTTSTSWRWRGACLRVDPELFFPVGTTGRAHRQAERAKHVCADCPVREACLDFAVTAGIEHGVWGGYSEEERRGLTRRTLRSRTFEGRGA
ncbi:MAG TPA: WhiB family transcriptional regulator [Propionibacteriaceae bacterium]|nr:WhiB family transcriptional regulator [Propionibacteriaceae bacterium]